MKRPVRRLTSLAAASAAMFCLCSSHLLAAGPDPSLWHPLRPSVSTFGDAIDGLYWFILWLTTIIFIGVQTMLLVFAWRYRAQEGGKAKFIHGNTRLEIVWTLIPVVILVSIAGYSQTVWKTIRVDIPADATKIECIAQQFAWFFRFPGEDNKFGPRDPRALQAARAANNTADPWMVDRAAKPQGWPEDQPAPGVDDYTIQGQVRVPADKDVRILLTSNDVLHSFFVPEFRIKHDAVPGMNGGRLWFHIPWDKVKGDDYASFDIVCAELCGLNHYSMRGELIVMPSGPVPADVAKMTGAELLALRDEDEDAFNARFLDRHNANWETYALVMSRLTAAESAAASESEY